MLYDKDIREPLFDYLEEKYGKVRILEEKRIGASRADAVMITENAIFGIEIKSDADTYQRLEGQVADYDTYYDYNYVVVGSKHAAHVHEHISSWWGILSVEEEKDDAGKVMVDFYEVRSPKKNPLVTWEKKIEILWRPELFHIQMLNDMPKYEQKSKAFVGQKIIECVDEEILQLQFCEELFERDYTQIAETINEYRKRKGAKPRRKRKYKRVKKKKG